MFYKYILAAICVLYCCVANAAESPLERLMHVRSLKCHFIGGSAMSFHKGQRELSTTTDEEVVPLS